MNKRTSTVVLAALVIESCALLVICLQSQPSWTERTSNIKPGEADYPADNTQARQFVDATFLVPASIHLQFGAVYTATLGRGDSPTPRPCHFATKTGTETEYSVTLREYSVVIPISPVFQNDESDEHSWSRGVKRYRAAIAVDKFAPRRCKWMLARLVYRERGSADFRLLSPFAGVRAGWEGFLRIWCKTQPATRETSVHQVCAGPLRDIPITSDMAFVSQKDARPISFPGLDGKVTIEVVDADHVLNQMILPSPQR